MEQCFMPINFGKFAAFSPKHVIPNHYVIISVHLVVCLFIWAINHHHHLLDGHLNRNCNFDLNSPLPGPPPCTTSTATTMTATRGVTKNDKNKGEGQAEYRQ